jgi:hypothetical protein
LNEDVDESVARDIDEMNGDIVNSTEITEEERNRQMENNMKNAHRDNYLRAACVHWKKVCATYRKKAKSLKKKMSFLNRHGVDENGDYAPNQLCSRFSRRMRLVSCFVVVDVVVCANDSFRSLRTKSRRKAGSGTMRMTSSHAWKSQFSSIGHIG